jgi:hypothetical protein
MIKICIHENEISERPNDFDLGEFIRAKYWELKDTQNGYSSKDDSIAEKLSRLNYKINDTEEKKQERETQLCSKDLCVLCGKESPYLVSTHIDLRIGYVEGAGQGCFQPHTCKSI